jgi:hypothetical protein
MRRISGVKVKLGAHFEQAALGTPAEGARLDNRIVAAVIKSFPRPIIKAFITTRRASQKRR